MGGGLQEGSRLFISLCIPGNWYPHTVVNHVVLVKFVL